MLHMTEKAGAQLKKIKDQVQREQPDSTLRLVPAGVGQFSLGIATTVERGDQELYHEDEKVLVVDQQTSTVLSDVTLDFEEEPQGGRFVFVKGGEGQE